MPTAWIILKEQIFYSHFFVSTYLQGRRQWSQYILPLVPAMWIFWRSSWSDWSGTEHDDEI
jgi:hypothetical protein